MSTLHKQRTIQALSHGGSSPVVSLGARAGSSLADQGSITFAGHPRNYAHQSESCKNEKNGHALQNRINVLASRHGNYNAQQLLSLIGDIKHLMQPLLLDPNVETLSHNLTKYLYSDVIPYDQKESGAEITKNIMLGRDPLYTTPDDEAFFLRSNHTQIVNTVGVIAQGRPVSLISIGCGPYVSVYSKDYAVAKCLLNAGINVSRYVAVDYNLGYSSRASDILVKEGTLPIKSADYYLAQDFVRPMEFKCQDNELPLLLFFGNTTAQFRSTQGPDGKSDLEKLFQNFQNSSKGNGLQFILHSEPNDDDLLVARKYKGDLMEAWAKSLWGLVRIASGDKDFSPCAFQYVPYCENGVVSLSFIAKKSTSLTLPGGPTYNIPRGIEVTIGYGEQHKPRTIIHAAEAAGWSKVPTRFHNPNTVRGIICAGPNVKYSPASIRSMIS